MSRAMNLNLPESDVIAGCAAANISISAIEVLPSGGTHLVCTTSEGAEQSRVRFRKHIIEGKVQRFPFFGIRSR